MNRLWSYLTDYSMWKKLLVSIDLGRTTPLDEVNVYSLLIWNKAGFSINKTVHKALGSS
jgi:hypothetical protein